MASRRDLGLRCGAMLIGAVLLAGCAGTLVPPTHSEAERFQVARDLMAKRQWAVANDMLKSYVANHPGGSDVDAAIYALGECELHLKDWAAAQVDFERLLRDYPESDSSGSAAVRLGDALYGQTRPTDFDQEFTQKALAQWQSYLRDYPGHWANADAEHKVATARRRLAGKLLDTARLYLKLGLKEPARTYFEQVERDYGDLDVVAEAWIGLARVEALEGKKDRAVERLNQVEARFAGQPIAREAARDRTRLER